MRPATPVKTLFLTLLFLPAQSILSQSSQPAPNPNFLGIKIPAYEYKSRDFQWLMRHPDLATTFVTRSQFGGNEGVDRAYRVTFPTLDIYSSAGVPVYFRDSSQVNLKVIDALPQSLPQPDLNPRYKVRPSLRKALSMVPGIPRTEWATPPQIDYTILSISLELPGADETPAQRKAIQRQKKRAMDPWTYSGTGPVVHVRIIHVPDPHPEETKRLALANQAANLAQEKAIQQLKSRLKGSRIRVIDVRLLH